MKKRILFLAVISLFLSFVFSSFAQVTDGPNYPSSGVEVNNASGTVSWSNIGNIYSNDGTYATASIPKNEITNYIVGTDYGFSIPVSATIDGITVELYRYSGANKTQDSEIYLTKDGVSTTGSNYAVGSNWGNSSWESATYGGAADLWGTTWTPAEINSSNFGVMIAVIQGSNGSVVAEFDYIRITVDYTLSPCATITAFPWTEDFDGETTPAMPACWAIEDNSAPDDDWETSSTYASSSPNSMFISWDGSNALDDWAFSPGFSLTGGTSYRIEFVYRASSSSYSESLELYYGTGQSSGSMSVELFDNASFANTTFDAVVVDFTPASSGDYYFGWHAYSIADQLGIYVDDIVVSISPSCPSPTNLSASSITATQADLSWTDNAGASLWDIELGTSGFSPSGTPTQTSVSNPYTYTGLSATTDYEYYVRANCGGGDYSNWVGPFAFTTACGTITPPWLEEFSSYLPYCWSETAGMLAAPSTLSGTTSSWLEDGFANVGTTGAAKVNIYSTTYDEWLISPSINLGTGTTDYQLEFDLALTDYGSSATPETDGVDDKFAVVISTDNGATWTSANTLQLWDNAGSPNVYNNISYTGEHVIIDLTGYTGVVQFGFYGESTVSNADNDLFVDNVEVKEIPTCPQPISLTVTNLLPDQVDLGWTEFGSATQWDIEYGASGFSQGTGTTVSGVNTNPYTITGLTGSTDYDFYVRADCGGGDLSDWSGPYTFTTADPYMVYTSSTVTQNNTDPVNRGSVDQEIICIEVVTTNPTSPLSITDFDFSTNGSTSAGTDILRANLYYTGTTAAFGNTTQFGTTVNAPNGSFTISGSQALAEGTNYFWLTYDINSGATLNNVVDAECTSITVDASAQTPTVTAPANNREILNVFLISDPNIVSTCTGYFYDSGGASGDYSSDEDYTKTFQSATPGSALQIEFTDFATEASYDELSIYDGSDVTAPLIGTYDGTEVIGTITSSGAYLTFEFTSDGSGINTGWDANISCVPITVPDCPTLDAPADTEVDVCPGSVNLLWTPAATGFAATGYKLYVGTTVAANELINGVDIGNVTSYNLPNLDGNTTFYWHVAPYNSAGTQTGCANYSFTTLNIGITSTNSPVNTCMNTANLTATGSGTITWYDQATGGSPIGTGSPYTASFNGNTTFYVAAESAGGGTEYGGMAANSSGSGFLGSSDEIGVVFDASEDFTLESAEIYPVGTGTVTVGLLNDAGTEIANSGAITITSGDGSAMTISLGFNISVGTNYKLVLRSYTGITDLYRDFTTTYPYDSPSGALSVTGGWWDGSTDSNYYFYNLEITSSCISAREAVEVIHTADPVSITPDGPITFLDGGSVGLTASSATSYTYTWSPATGLNTTTGANVTASPNTTTTYTVTGDNGSCAYSEEITITVTYPCTGLGTGHTPISSLPFSESSTTCGAVDDITSSNATVCGSTSYYTGEDVVYSFTPTTDGSITINLTSTGTFTGIMLYDDCPMSGQGGSCMGYSQSSSGDETMCVSVQQDVTYYLVVDSYDSPDCNPYTISISAPDPAGVPGDLPCDAIPVAIGGIQSGDNGCATGVDEPSAATCWDTGIVNTIWYSFEAPASGTVKIRTILGSLTSTQIAVYQGVCSNLSLVSNACNTDATGTCSGTEEYSNLELTGLTSGSTYYIRVDGENELTGTFEVQVIDGTNDWPAVPQQDCGSATLVCAQQTVVGDPGFVGAGSTCDYTTPYGCFSFGTQNNTVWYQIDVDATGALTFEIVPNLSTTDYDWALVNVTGISDACDQIAANTLSPTRCNFSGTSGTTGLSASATETSVDAGGAPFCSEVSATAGETYLLLIWNWSGNNTGFTLDLYSSPLIYDTPDQVTWSGGASTDWFDPINWGGCTIPSCGIDAIIVNGPTNQPVISADGAECANITIESGASLTIDAARSLTVCENFNNSGSLNADATSTILINHASNSHEINGSLVGTNALGNLTIDKAAGTVSFMQDIEISGDLITANVTSLINTNAHNVIIGGDFEPFSGTFTGIGTTGRLTFNGSALQSYNPGGTLTLNHVTINNTGAGVALSNNMILGVNGVLTLTHGIIETGTNRVEIRNTDPTAVSAGNMNAFINTDLRRYIATNAGDYNFPVGTSSAYRLAKMTNNNLTGVTYVDAEFITGFSNSGSLNASLALDNTVVYQEVASEGIWRLNPDAAPSGGTYAMSLYFDDGQGYDVSGNPIGDGFTGLIDNQFAVLKRPSGSTSAADWVGESVGSIPADNGLGRLVDDGFAKRSGISAFSEFGIGKDNTILPIELMSFTASCMDDLVVVNWTTAVEINNDFFTLYRSTDGEHFEKLDVIQGQGNSTYISDYSYVDEKPAALQQYYRLQQTDYDGTSTWSDVIYANCVKTPGEFHIVPNPFKDELYVMFDESTPSGITLRINDMLGNVIFETVIPEHALKYRIIELEKCLPGTYFISIMYNDSVKTQKLIKM